MGSMAYSLLSFLLPASSCAFSPKQPASSSDLDQNRQDTLIVFLSRTRNTKALAEIVHDQVGGTVVELELENPYPENYRAIVAQVARENETGFLPALKTRIENLDRFEVVFIGFPTWDMKLPPPMKSFLHQYDLSGKTVIPFNTNAGYGVGSSFETIEQLCPDSRILPGFSTKGGIERDGILFVMEGKKEKEVQQEVRKWLERLNLRQPEKNE
jgi:flavodoxin